MTNHVHVILQPGERAAGLGQLMKPRAGRQTRYVNRQERRTATLWEVERAGFAHCVNRRASNGRWDAVADKVACLGVRLERVPERTRIGYPAENS